VTPNQPADGQTLVRLSLLTRPTNLCFITNIENLESSCHVLSVGINCPDMLYGGQHGNFYVICVEHESTVYPLARYDTHCNSCFVMFRLKAQRLAATVQT
jgi:hypothetical protein